ncbi:MAG: hypothetical protein AABW50_04240 [Nanoarchaeota archaeon]
MSKNLSKDFLIQEGLSEIEEPKSGAGALSFAQFYGTDNPFWLLVEPQLDVFEGDDF